MKKSYQVTLYCTTGKYRPVSAVVTVDQEAGQNLLEDKERKKELINKGIINICVKRYWNNNDLKRYNYTKVKIREYIKE